MPEEKKQTPKKTKPDKVCACESDCTCGCQEGSPCSCSSQPTSDTDALLVRLAEYEDIAKRTQADFENYRRRTNEAMLYNKTEGTIAAVIKFLPCLDNILKAKSMIKDKKVLDGLEMIENSMRKALFDMGVDQFESLGKMYNPKFHSVIAVVNDKNHADGEIMNVAEEGYSIKDRIIRYAQVIVNKLS